MALGSKGVWKCTSLILANSIAIITGNGAPTNGTAGTFAKRANKGSLYIDYSTGNWYTNTNTQASPTWTQVTLP